MAESVKLLAERNGAVRIVDRDDAAAIPASVQMGAVVLIEREVPPQSGFSPIARVADDDVLKAPDKIVGEIGGPVAAGDFREVDVLVRVGVVDGRLGIDRAGIRVKCRTGEILPRDRDH